MTQTTVNFFTAATDDGPRYSDFRAVIDLADARRYREQQPTVRLVADDSLADINGHADDPAVILNDSDIPGTHTSDHYSGILFAAVKVLKADGLRVCGEWRRGRDVWTVAVEPARQHAVAA